MKTRTMWVNIYRLDGKLFICQPHATEEAARLWVSSDAGHLCTCPIEIPEDGE